MGALDQKIDNPQQVLNVNSAVPAKGIIFSNNFLSVISLITAILCLEFSSSLFQVTLVPLFKELLIT